VLSAVIGREGKRWKIGIAVCAKETDLFAWRGKMSAAPIPPMYSGHFSSCVHGCVSVSLTIQGFTCAHPVRFGDGWWSTWRVKFQSGSYLDPWFQHFVAMRRLLIMYYEVCFYKRELSVANVQLPLICFKPFKFENGKRYDKNAFYWVETLIEFILYSFVVSLSVPRLRWFKKRIGGSNKFATDGTCMHFV